MKTIETKKTKIAATFIAVVLVLWFSSCSSYRNGFIRISSAPGNIISMNMDSLQRQKEELNVQAVEIISGFDSVKIREQAIPPALLNRLFENLQAHYRLDSVHHRILYTSNNDSLKTTARGSLIRSAAGYHLFFQHRKDLRRIVNRGDQAFHVTKKTLLHSQRFLWAPANRELLKHTLPQKPVRHSKCRFLCRKCTDSGHAAFYQTTGFLSELFGRSVARIHKEPEPGKNVSRLMPYLQKWDIVLQKSPGRLTDRFIPGYFGHAGIYIGDSVFIESIQDGVITTGPFHFAEGGSFLVIRLDSISEKKEKHIQQLVRSQTGKKYDFNFDVNSPDCLFCTELISLVFDDIDWKTRKSAGRITMCPDNIIETALSGNTFCFPLFFDEEQLIENPSHAFVESLLKKEDGD
ncbi:MAG: YiiX/YebB-like N1pC/P60 family cysteine hydrolase [Prolixibacteraceae bacterium]|jgi:hypothetical protein|nr:YiiX/YebB-like N1pC/P60 family cysteine hydrolase [Prolixibacteraceae bacterium]